MWSVEHFEDLIVQFVFEVLDGVSKGGFELEAVILEEVIFGFDVDE